MRFNDVLLSQNYHHDNQFEQNCTCQLYMSTHTIIHNTIDEKCMGEIIYTVTLDNITDILVYCTLKKEIIKWA